MTRALPLGFTDLALLLTAAGLFLRLFRSLHRRSKTTRLQGPAKISFIFGVSKYLSEAGDPSPIYEQWAEKYGSVFVMPVAMGRTQMVICDPKAISHFYSKETYGYIQTGFTRVFIEMLLGKGLLWAEGDSHKRQRKTLTPAFSNAAIRDMLPIFVDSGYKVKDAWDNLLEPAGEAIIDVQEWMNHVSLDTIGIAGFSHDFGTLRGKRSAIADVFDAFGRIKPTFSTIILFVLSAAFPMLWRVPSERGELVKKFAATAEEISQSLIDRTRKDTGDIGEGKGDRSVIGLLIKASDSSSESHISDQEVMAQMKALILAGYETTSISLTWTLLELAKKPELQARLREELTSHFGSGGDPTYEQLNNGLPYLDAVVHETLRMHAPVWQTMRISTEDDIIPLSEPLRTADHQLVDRISIAASQEVLVPIRMVNRSTSVWGSDAKEYRPERWLDEEGLPSKVKEVQGHRHLLTFVDGPRTCLGKTFALAEFKAVLSILVRNYTFELSGGSEAKFAMGRGILPRPKVADEDGCRIPLRVRRIE